jgi:hypothetical protein
MVRGLPRHSERVSSAYGFLVPRLLYQPMALLRSRLLEAASFLCSPSNLASKPKEPCCFYAGPTTHDWDLARYLFGLQNVDLAFRSQQLRGLNIQHFDFPKGRVHNG